MQTHCATGSLRLSVVPACRRVLLSRCFVSAAGGQRRVKAGLMEISLQLLVAGRQELSPARLTPRPEGKYQKGRQMFFG